MGIQLLILYLTHISIANAQADPTSCNHSLLTGHVIEDMMIGYDKQAMPNPAGMNVTIEIHVQEVSSLSELSSDFVLDIFYSEMWIDPALAFANYSLCKSNVTLKSQFRERIWRPDTCVVNSKAAELHNSPSENSFVILYADGTVWVNYRMIIKAPCRMELAMFPFDSQECFLIFESYAYNSQELQLNWYNEPVTVMSPIDLPDFMVEGIKTEHFKVPYPNGIWDRLKVTFTFSRRSGFYLFQAYFPSGLTVISSWIGFYLDVRSTSARLTLGVSSLLALTFQFGTVLRHLPRVSYVKCLDVWMMFCVAIIFLTLIELAIISRLTQNERARQLSLNVFNRWLMQIRRRRRMLQSDRKANLSSITATTSLCLAALDDTFESVEEEKKNSMVGAEPKAEPVVANGALDENRRRARNFYFEPAASTEHEISIDFSRLNVADTDAEKNLVKSATPTVRDTASPMTFRRAVRAIRERVRFAFGQVVVITRCLLCCGRLSPLTAVQVDSMSIVCFPCGFALFNLVYWIYYIQFMRFR